MSDVLISGAPSNARLLDVLQRLLPIHFIGNQRANARSTTLSTRDGLPDQSLVLQVPASTRTCRETGKRPCRVVFADEPEVPFPYRNRVLETALGDVSSVEPQSDERVLARSGERVLWTVRTSDRARRFRSALPLPSIDHGDSFFDIFNGECFLYGLILLEFLRQACPHPRFEPSPLRAAFVIDDPNLHWPRYGSVDFLRLASRAHDRRYHVCIGTIPIDSWFAHPEAVRVFRQHKDALSLLIHGNNHAHEELATDYSPEARAGLLSQAIRRIERFECRSGLRVSRVMVPPHGACSAAMLGDLPPHGFESACISSGSLRAHNRDQPWVGTLGYAPAESINGCPVLPRWALTGLARSTALTAAYLGQPMIFRGHPKDFKQGLEVFDELAAFINALGPVRWCDMSSLSRLNFLWKLDNATLRLRVLGRRTDIELPPTVAEVIFDAPNNAGEWLWGEGGSVRGRLKPGVAMSVANHADRKFHIERALTPSPAALGEPPRSSMRFHLRRFATEARDRFLSL